MSTTPAPPEEQHRDVWWRVDDIATVAAVRRSASTAADRLGFAEARSGEVGIVASELATNLVRHAGGGELVLRPGQAADGGAELRLLSIDSGPGRRNIRRMIVDGESTGGTLGIGLGACQRIANHFDVHSVPGVGTIVETVVRADAHSPMAPPRVDSLTRPLADELRCGDAATHRVVGDHALVLLSDGLGHGPMAAEASQRAVEAFHESRSTAPAVILERVHEALSSTRGAAVSVLRHDAEGGELCHAGVGNIAVRLLGETTSQAMASQPGIVGHRMPRVRELSVPVGEARFVVLHSDGLSQRWNLDDLPGLLDRSAGTVCAALMRMAASGRDDASVIAMGVTR